MQYNAAFIFNQLSKINDVRNRIAYHEPICFVPHQSVKSTVYARHNYNLLCTLFQWMRIDEARLLYGLDHIAIICDRIDAL